MSEKMFRPALYENDPDPPVTIADVEKAYAWARRVYEPNYLHPPWRQLAKKKARIFIDAVTMGAHDNGIALSAATVVWDCVSAWDEFRNYVARNNRRIVLAEPSIGALLKSFEHAVRFSLGKQHEQRTRKRLAAKGRELMKQVGLI